MAMMHAAISLATLGAMLVHVVAGCCAHHAHTDCEAHRTTTAVQNDPGATRAVYGGHKECEHSHRSAGERASKQQEHRLTCQHSSASPDHDSPAVCEKDSCKYVGTTDVKLPKQTVCDLGMQLAVDDAAAFSLQQTRPFWVPHLSAAACATGARVHEMTHVWLL